MNRHTHDAMREPSVPWERYARWGLALLSVACWMFLLPGCAVGRTNTGGIVFGAELGTLADNINEAAGSFATAGLAALGIGIPGAGALVTAGIGWARSYAASRAATAAHQAENRGWDMAHGVAPSAGAAPVTGNAGNVSGAGGAVASAAPATV